MSWLTSVAGNLLLFCLVFGMSATVDIRCMQAQIRNTKALLMGIFCQFVILPFLGFIVVRFLELDEALGLTLLVVTSSPGGSYSNWWCSMFNGDLALSVTMTAISTVLSMIALPVNLLIYTKFSYQSDVVESLDWNALFTALAIVMGAIILGLSLSAQLQGRPYHRRLQYLANHLGNISGFCLILFSALMANNGDADSKIWSRHWTFYLGVCAPCLGGLILANILASVFDLPKPERVTVAIECCYQNVGIATSLAMTMFKGDDRNDAMGVPFFYGMMEALLVGIYCLGAWKAGWTKAPADASLFTILWTSYEVLELESGLVNVNGIEIDVSTGPEANQTSCQDSQIGDIITTYIHWDNVKKDPEASSAEDDKKASGTGLLKPTAPLS